MQAQGHHFWRRITVTSAIGCPYSWCQVCMVAPSVFIHLRQVGTVVPSVFVHWHHVYTVAPSVFVHWHWVRTVAPSVADGHQPAWSSVGAG